MIERLFTETFFKKNSYFKKELGISEETLKKIKKSIDNWQRNCKNFNPDFDKETTDENEFINIVFKDILGYIGKGTNSQSYHIYPKFKIDNAGVSGGSGYADLALGYFTKEKTDEAQVLVEFKDLNSDDLDKATNRKDKLSPVNQCWNYLDFYGKAKWGIVTNFNEIRIYHKNKGKRFYEVFYFNVPEEYKDKFKPLSDENEILKFICILKSSNLLINPELGKGNSFTDEILISQGAAEKKVQDEFYTAYKSLRTEIFYEALKYNPQFEQEKSKSELLQLVQKFLDRIIFCWFCEDSREHLIPSNVLSADLIQTQTKNKYYNPQHFSIYGKVKDLFQAIDEGRAFGIDHGYNGELFKPDSVLDALKLPNFLFEKIADIGLKYDFGDENELNVNILGHIFEQSISDLEEMRIQFQEFSQEPSRRERSLTVPQSLPFVQSQDLEQKKLDVLEHKHQEFDPKKTKRKKEGVYYTPDYITKYIVENTVGEWLKEKWNDAVKKNANVKKGKEYKILIDYRTEYLSKIKILDPACGSGAFLIAAFDYLWKEHERVYKEIKELKSKTAQGELFDFDSINKTILENNLYGVDLNRESVEITKLSLWLKTAAKNKKLNNLTSNIKNGNSLVDDKNVAGELAFDWKKEFPAMMNAGGFDVVIGNPPYVFAREKISQEEKDFYVKNYDSAQYQVNTYLLFIEKGLKLLSQNAQIGMIVPNAWLMVSSAKNLREYLLSNTSVKQIINLSGYSFEGVNVETIIMIGVKELQKNNEINIFLSNGKLFEFSHKKKQDEFSKNEGSELYVFSDDKESKLLEKIKKNTTTLDDLTLIKAGLQAYEAGKGNPKQTPEDVKTRPYDYNYKFDSNTYEYLEGKDVNRYFINWSGSYLQYGEQLAAPRTIDIFKNPNIIIREITGKYPKMIIGCYNNYLYLFNRSNIAVLEKSGSDIDLKFIIALINSSLISYYFLLNTAKSVRLMFPKVILEDLRRFPIKNISPKDQKPFIEKADTMLSKNKELQVIQKDFTTLLISDFKIEKLTEKLEDWYLLEWSEFANELKKKKVVLEEEEEVKWLKRFERMKKEALVIKNVIDSTDREIDVLVYELYGLTDEEIAIVEGVK